MVRARKLFQRTPKIAPRRRRAPELARTELLDAAERVFAEFQPDQVGLKEIAGEAGVSHALVTHYFGTYAGLVEATLERRVRALRAELLGRVREVGALAQPARLLAILFQALSDPVHLRLMRWLLASERPSANQALALQDQGLQLIAFEVGKALLGPDPPRAKIVAIEDALLTAVSAAYGYAIGKYALATALGRPVDHALDVTVQHTLAQMIQAHLREVLGVEMPHAR